MRRLALVTLLIAAAFGCSKKEEPKALPKNTYVYEPVRIASAYASLVEQPYAKRALFVGAEAKAHTNYFARAGVQCHTAPRGRFDLIVVACDSMSKASCGKLCESLAEGGVVVWLMDVGGVTAEEMLERFRGFSLGSFHLWMPGSSRWLLIGRQAKAKVRLAEMFDVFVRERTFEDLARARCGTIPEVFANYVGTADDVVPAFFNLAKDEKMGPGLFVTKDVPKLDWLDAEGVDDDIRKSVLAEIRSLQIVRREVIRGALAIEAVKDKKDEEKATEILSRAALRNPNDLFVLERLDRLERNAQGFLSLGKILMAMKCYETMVLIRPDDASAVHNFGMCLKKIGKLDLAEKILKRAETLASKGAPGTADAPAATTRPSASVEGQGKRFKDNAHSLLP